jgi:hypothetical protein
MVAIVCALRLDRVFPALEGTVLPSGSKVVTDLDELSAIPREAESYLP